MKTKTYSLACFAATFLAALSLRAEVPGPAYHWAMDDVSGNTVGAASDAVHQDTLTHYSSSTLQFATIALREAAAYNAVTNCDVYTGNNNIQLGSQGFTIATSLQICSETKKHILVFGSGGTNDASNTNGFALVTGEVSDEIRLVSWKSRNNSNIANTAVSVVARLVVPNASKRLHHYALAFESKDADGFRVVRIYVDGRYAARGTLALPEMYDNYPMQFSAPKSNSQLGGYGLGGNIVVDDLAIYQAALTAEQVAEIAPSFPVWPTEDYAGMYVYVGNGASLNEPSSWMLNGETPESAPGNQDVAVFPSDVTVALDEAVSISNVVLFANLTLTSTSAKTFKFHEAFGPGRFILVPDSGSTVDLGQLNGQGGAAMYTSVEFKGEGGGTCLRVHYSPNLRHSK